LLTETGRRYGLDTILISQQPNLIHNRIRNQLMEVVTFCQVDGQAMVFSEENGFEDDQVRGLVPGQFLVRNLSSGATAAGRMF
jgi:hypothetical protein